MRIFFSEFPPDYDNYNFPYQVYALKEDGDSYEELYEGGLLPTRIDNRLFYMARSLRVNLERFELSSENRRIKKKASYLEMELVPLADFDYDYPIGKLAKDFYDERFGKGTMSAQKVKWLFNEGAMTHVAVYRDNSVGSGAGDSNGAIFGYCLCVVTDKLIHYAYPFYDLSYFKKNAGMAMMLSITEYAKDKGLSHLYLGTIYTESSLYKLQISGSEYYVGFGWSEDIEQLKWLVKESRDTHLFNLVEEKSEFLDSMLGE